jgi:hypothetical protein
MGEEKTVPANGLALNEPNRLPIALSLFDLALEVLWILI